MTNCETPESPKHLVAAPNGATTPAGESVVARPRPHGLARLLGDGEIIILELKPSLWYIPMVSAPVVLLGVIVMLAPRLAIFEPLCSGLHPVLYNLGAGIIGLRLAAALCQWYSRTYMLTDRRVIRQKGVFNIQIFECSLDRLQNTFILRTVMQRLLGIGTILFATAGTRHIEPMWQHVARPVQVHKAVTEAAEKFRARSGGQGL